MQGRAPPYQCSIVACARWETDAIVEWLTYHASIGFQHVYLYCNDDDPAPLHAKVLPFLSGPHPFVTFLHFRFQGRQRLMYLHFLRGAVQRSQWVMFLDIDEFLYLPRDGTVGRLLGRIGDNVDVLYVNWLMFGNAGHVERPAGSVLENFTRHEPALHPYNKVIVRTAAMDIPAVAQSAIHFWHDWPATRPGIRRLNVFGDRMDDYHVDFPQKAAAYVQAQGMLERALAEAVICHFCIKSEADFGRRVDRGIGGEFAMQVSWAERQRSGDYRALLESLNAVEFTGLRDYWRRLHAPARIPSVTGHPAGANLALRQAASQSSVSPWSLHQSPALDAAGAVNGQVTGLHQFHTAEEDSPWWEVDLGRPCTISQITVFNRLDPGQERLRHFTLSAALQPGSLVEIFRKTDDAIIGGLDGFPLRLVGNGSLRARIIRIRLIGYGFLHLDQVEIHGTA